MFHGEFEHSVDAKGRTSLPVKFRELLLLTDKDEEVVIAPALEIVPSYLMCHSTKSFARLLKGAEELPPYDEEAQFFIETVVHRAQTCSVDKLGRIQLPPKLREEYGIRESVTWAGAISHVQVWSTEAYQAKRSKRREFSNHELVRSLASKLRPKDD